MLSTFATHKSVKRARNLCCDNYKRYTVSKAKRRANRTFRRSLKQQLDCGAIEAFSEFNPSTRSVLDAWHIT